MENKKESETIVKISKLSNSFKDLSFTINMSSDEIKKLSKILNESKLKNKNTKKRIIADKSKTVIDKVKFYTIEILCKFRHFLMNGIEAMIGGMTPQWTNLNTYKQDKYTSANNETQTNSQKTKVNNYKKIKITPEAIMLRIKLLELDVESLEAELHERNQKTNDIRSLYFAILTQQIIIFIILLIR